METTEIKFDLKYSIKGYNDSEKCLFTYYANDIAIAKDILERKFKEYRHVPGYRIEILDLDTLKVIDYYDTTDELS